MRFATGATNAPTIAPGISITVLSLYLLPAKAPLLFLRARVDDVEPSP